MLSFGHEALAKRIADELLDSLKPGAGSSTEPALVVGVFGEWGAGKSRLLQTIGAHLQEAGRVNGEQVLTVVVPFNAWRFEREEHLLVPLLRVAQQCLRKAIDDSLGTDIKRHERLSDQLLLLGDLAQVVYEHGGRDLLQAALTAHGAAIKLPPLKPAEGKPNPGAWQVLSARRKLRANARRLDTPISQLQSLYYDFLEHLKAVTGRNPSALDAHRQRLLRRGAGWLTDLGFSLRMAGEWLLTGEVAAAPSVQVNLVFLVDDLDRCLPDKAVEVLEAVKLFLEVEGCAFVLALDEEVIERGIAHRYRDYSLQGKEGMTPITGAEYLEKLVHLPVRLPRPTGIAAQVFLAEKLADWFADAQGRPNALAVLVAAITPAVPRKLMRMMTLLRTAEALGAGDVQMPQRREWLAIVCALQLFAPALYRFLRLRGARLLITLSEWHDDRLFRDMAGLKEALARQVRAADSQLQLQHRLMRQRLPDLCEAALNNRSGFDLLELLERVRDLNRAQAVKSAQLGAVMAFTEAELEPEPGEATAAAVPPVAGTGAGPGPAAAPELPPALAPAPLEPPAWLAPPQVSPAAPAVAPAAAEQQPAPTVASPALSPEIARLGAGLAPQPFDPGDPSVLPALPEARLENEKALVEALASGDLELSLVALSREGSALAGSLLPASLWMQVWDGPLRHRLVEWAKKDAAEGPLSQLLVELQPYLSQRVAHELIRRVGSSVQRWLHRPSWASEVRVGEELALLAPPLVGARKVWLHTREAQAAAAWAIPRGWECRVVKAGNWPEPALSASLVLGADSLFGVFADLTLSDSDDRPSVTQRLRWIEPSTFVMGSPAREEGRRPEEGGARNVRLNHGYWMADTACTQGLWRVVMGVQHDRPGGDEFDAFPMVNITPVEIDAFLDRLNQIVEGCDFALPTEAEWECACRAGTRSSYAFGARVGVGQVHARAAGSLQVRSLPPNAWGLYEMHGNVGELCRDWLRDNQRAVREDVDPVGDAGMEAGIHAVRGGSFKFDYPDTRSAALGKLGHNDRRDDVGFRFIVRAS